MQRPTTPWHGALLAKHNPVIMALEGKSREESLAQGREESLAQGREVSRLDLEALCEAFEIPFGSERRARLQALDVASLHVLLDRIRTERRWP